MISSPYEKYRQSAVQTAPSQLLIMLYDGAIRFVKGGIEGIKEQDVQKSNEFFKKAQDIVSELRASLDYSYEVSQNLSSLYEYVNYLLIEANIKKRAQQAEEALGYLVELREAWSQAAKLNTGNSDHVTG
ncbi:flagellar export chaperone FliS [Paenibacillus pabuli]|uniref:flagellar export chaperone FliS n=1 Tax=Paenibacillus pabuli TaxID=1472 RepID=UPI001FFFF8DE|nr:flagellar export chaperone FliS [Paenibacillus pabuli]UPK43467.1 flagellar export chaperone FliS [Paenibacillus pabuli]